METIKINEANKYCTKDITAWTRQQLRQKYPDLKLSVTCEYYSGGSSMSIVIKESKKVRFKRKFEELTEEELFLGSWDKPFIDGVKE